MRLGATIRVPTRGWWTAAGLAASLLTPGCTLSYGAGCAACVYAYHPMSGLNGPIVIDPTLPNFEGLRLAVHCPPGGDLGNGDRDRLCRRVSTLFENQGATVETFTGVAIAPDPMEAPGARPAAEPTPGQDLRLQVRSRVLHHENPTLSWAISLATFTLVPAKEEEAFALDVTVSDSRGFLLAENSLQGRVTRRFGVGTVVANWTLDRLVRTREDRLTRPNAEQELSADLYGHLSQLVFNAQMRADVLGESPRVAR